MKNNIAVFIWMAWGSFVNSQNPSGDSLKALSFDWSTLVDRNNWEDEKVKVELLTSVRFFGNYKSFWVCEFNYNGKCYPEYLLYEKVNERFIQISNIELFNNNQSALIKMANEKIQKDFKDLKSNPDSRDCVSGQDELLPLPMESMQIAFSINGLSISYYFDFGTYCDFYNYSSVEFSWYDILPYLKNQNTQTPNYCTPSGPKVNVRSDQSVNASVNFQLDRGEFFEILEVGKKDKVNGKDGSWYKIDYQGKGGYIFSFYTLCKD